MGRLPANKPESKTESKFVIDKEKKTIESDVDFKKGPSRYGRSQHGNGLKRVKKDK